MMYIGQLAKFTDNGALFIYAGFIFPMETATGGYAEGKEAGVYGLMPEFENLGQGDDKREYTSVTDGDGEVVVGKFARDIDCGFWGVIDPSLLTDNQRDLIRKTIAEGYDATNKVAPQLSVSDC